MTFLVVPVATTVTYAVGSTATTDFAIPFPFDDLADVQVWAGAVLVPWSLIGGAQADGFWSGTVARLISPVSNTSVAILRAAPLVQRASFPIAGRFSVAALNQEVSRLWMAQQDRDFIDSLAVRAPFGETTPGLLPSRASRANKALGFDASGQLVATTYDIDFSALLASAGASATSATASAVAAALSAAGAATSLVATTTSNALTAQQVATAAAASAALAVLADASASAAVRAAGAANQSLIAVSAAQTAYANALNPTTTSTPELLLVGFPVNFGDLAITASPFLIETLANVRIDYARGNGTTIDLGSVT